MGEGVMFIGHYITTSNKVKMRGKTLELLKN
jgi:hypothetical protein